MKPLVSTSITYITPILSSQEIYETQNPELIENNSATQTPQYVNPLRTKRNLFHFHY
jgi:hypothetical protein